VSAREGTMFPREPLFHYGRADSLRECARH
jgi:hypothetical protein